MAYSLAFDIGTTTIVGYLCDTIEKTVLCTIENSNPQSKYGLDVISRITYAGDSDENKDEISMCLGDTVKIMIEELEKAVKNSVHGIRKETPMQVDESFETTVDISANIGANADVIERMIVVCNPVIMGFFSHYLDIAGSDIGVDRTKIYLLPSVGGYVGADALAASYEVETIRCKKHTNAILVDIGTNTEIVLLTDNILMATSAAAGPALEGGNIRCGMRGEPGAIDSVTICETGTEDVPKDETGTEIKNKMTKAVNPTPQKNDIGQAINDNTDINIHVIGDIEAQGICGSGILDIIAVLLKMGIVDNTGYLCSKDEALTNKVPIKLANRIKDVAQDGETGITTRIFRLTDSIGISQDDIRAIQLAKSAIRSGIEMLLLKNNLTASVIDEIYLAGAFGLYINVESALSIGMIPVIENSTIIQSGNLAGIGACHIATELDIITDVINFKNDILTISLDRESAFQDMFFKYMNFEQ